MSSQKYRCFVCVFFFSKDRKYVFFAPLYSNEIRATNQHVKGRKHRKIACKDSPWKVVAEQDINAAHRYPANPGNLLLGDSLPMKQVATNEVTKRRLLVQAQQYVFTKLIRSHRPNFASPHSRMYTLAFLLSMMTNTE